MAIYGKPVKKTAVRPKASKKKPTKTVPKGFHRMPNGKLMKGATHKSRSVKGKKKR